VVKSTCARCRSMLLVQAVRVVIATNGKRKLRGDQMGVSRHRYGEGEGGIPRLSRGFVAQIARWKSHAPLPCACGGGRSLREVVARQQGRRNPSKDARFDGA